MENENFKNIDVLVVGGGLMGLSSAWRLAKEGLKVSIFEKDTCGKGASAYSLGVLAYPSPLRKTNFHKVHRISLGMTENFYKEIQQESGIDVEYIRIGSLEIIPGPSQYQQAKEEVDFTQSDECDADTPKLEIIPPEDLIKLEPNILQTEFGAVYAEKTARITVDSTISALKEACIRQGVKIYENFKIQELLIENDEAKGVISEKGEKIFANNVLVTSGAWSGTLGKESAFYAYMEGIRGQALEVESEEKLAGHIIKYNKGYIIPSLKNTYGIGSTTEKNVGYDNFATIEGITEILTRAKETLPKIADCKINRIWAGLRPAGRDRKPHIGKTDSVKNLFFACGHYKIGFGYAPITSQIIVDEILGRKILLPIDELKPRDAVPLNKKNKKEN